MRFGAPGKWRGARRVVARRDRGAATTRRAPGETPSGCSCSAPRSRRRPLARKRSSPPAPASAATSRSSVRRRRRHHRRVGHGVRPARRADRVARTRSAPTGALRSRVPAAVRLRCSRCSARPPRPHRVARARRRLFAGCCSRAGPASRVDGRRRPGRRPGLAAMELARARLRRLAKLLLLAGGAAVVVPMLLEAPRDDDRPGLAPRAGLLACRSYTPSGADAA